MKYLSQRTLRGLLLVLLAGTTVQQAFAKPDRELGTGLKPETSEGRRWLDKHFPVTKTVRSNDLAKTRFREEKRTRKADSSAAGSIGTQGSPLMALPSTVDNSTLAAFPPIRSQGGVGSCIAWSTTYYQHTYEQNLANGLAANTGDNNQIYSPKWTYNLINNGSDSGSYFSDAYRVLTRNGATKWAAFPYDTNYLEWNLDKIAWRDAINSRGRSQQGQLIYSDSTGFDPIKQMLANGRVLVIGTYIRSFQNSLLKNDPNVLEDDTFVGQASVAYMDNLLSGGHGMTIVGYNDVLWTDINGNNTVEPGEKGAFKVANSWGTGYGNAGFIWIAYDAFRTTSQVPGVATNRRYLLQSNALYWMTPSANYSPKLVAEFTINTANRAQMSISLGIATVGASAPTTTWTTGALGNPGAAWQKGGAFGFSGTTAAVDGTFTLDFTDLNPNPQPGSTNRYFLQVADSATGNPLTISSFNLTDGNGILLAQSSNANFTRDGSSGYAYLDYTVAGTANVLPVAGATANPTSGYGPLAVTFDAGASSDSDGSIVSYDWNFGDGTYGSGVTVSHTYTTYGTFIPQLTVTDNSGGTSTTSLSVIVTNPNQVNAPSNLTGIAVVGANNLSWSDNSANEDGFYIERALKGRGSLKFSRIGVVGQSTTSFSDNSVSSRATYVYRVQGFKNNPATLSLFSNQLQIRAN